MNKLLTGSNRDMYDGMIKNMFKTIPHMMARKIKDANVQQAFVVRTVMNLHKNKENSILCAGHYDDTAYGFLYEFGFNVIGVDPTINFPLHEFKSTTSEKYKTIFSTSVIEHVEDDEEFIRDICELLDDDGVAILTCDFNDNYKDGDDAPLTVVRQYTKYDLEVRIPEIIAEYGCSVVGKSNYDGEYDFEHSGFVYTFATLVFKKD